MITTAQMYWLTRLDCFCGLAFVVAIVSVLLPIFVSLAVTHDEASAASAFFRTLKWTALPLVISLCVLMFVPTTKEMAAILIVPRIANSEKVQQAGNKLYELAVEWMDELKPGKKKEGSEK